MYYYFFTSAKSRKQTWWNHRMILQNLFIIFAGHCVLFNCVTWRKYNRHIGITSFLFFENLLLITSCKQKIITRLHVIGRPKMWTWFLISNFLGKILRCKFLNLRASWRRFWRSGNLKMEVKWLSDEMHCQIYAFLWVYWIFLA